MRKPLLLITVAMLVGMLIPGFAGDGHGRVAPRDPLTCDGYRERRFFFESQAWWQPTVSGNQDLGHIHVGTCFPHAQTVSGVVNFDLAHHDARQPGQAHLGARRRRSERQLPPVSARLHLP
ncbi:MAG: hypothetical protein ACRDU8_03515 [Egibacteraceae bacterium]